MPPQKPSKKRILAANGERTSRHSSSGSRTIDEILPAKRPIEAPPTSPKRISTLPTLYKPPEFKKRIFKKRSKEEIARMKETISLRAIHQLERRWLAVCHFSKHQRYDGSIPSEQVPFIKLNIMQKLIFIIDSENYGEI